MLVTQSVESNINILAKSKTAKNISSALKDMPFGHYRCEDFVDIIMIPCFITILDGHVLTKDSLDIDLLECFLTDWSGRMRKCRRCGRYHDCLESSDAEKDIDTGPHYKAPFILLHSDKKQRDVEGLVALIPSMTVEEPFSPELKTGLNQRVLSCIKGAWWKYDKWIAIECEKDTCKQKTFAEIVEERWLPKNIKIG